MQHLIICQENSSTQLGPRLSLSLIFTAYFFNKELMDADLLSSHFT